MRVFYDHQVTSLQDAGGVSRYYFELVRSLLQTAQVDPGMLLGFHNNLLPFSSLRPAARLLSWRSPVPAGSARYALNEALTLLASPWLRRFDVYHATYQRVLPMIRNVAVVVTHHDSTPDRFPELFRNAPAIHARLQKVYARADRILCISSSSRQDLLDFYQVPVEKTVVIPHGFSPIAPADVAPGLLPHQPYLLYVGARHAYKNFPLLLQALAMQPDTGLHAVVAGGGAYTAAEAALLARLRIVDRVHLLPRPADAQLAAVYRGARMFVYPSLYEGFGFPPLEAMAAGCPALVSQSSALPEVCGDAAFYFDPRVCDDLAALIHKLHHDDTLRLSKQAAGARQVQKYTWHKTAAQTLEAYRDAIDSRQS